MDMIVTKKVYNMGIRGNSGFKVQDKRFGTDSEDVKGLVSRHQHFLERTEGRFEPPAEAGGLFYKTYINETFESGGFITEFSGTSDTYRWIEENTDTPNIWEVGTDQPYAGTYSAYISDDGGTSNTYDVDTVGDNFIKFQFRVPTDWPTTAHTMDLSFIWRCKGEGTTTMYDYGYLLYTTTGYTINAGTTITDARILGNVAETNTFNNAYQTPSDYGDWYEQTGSLNVAGDEGGVLQLTWAWRNDGTLGGSPPFAIDNITLKYSGTTAP